MGTVQEGEEALERAGAQVRNAWNKWVESQAEALREFLFDEARLAATNQLDRTEEMADGVPAFRRALEAEAAKAAEHFRQWASGKDDDTVLGLGEGLKDEWDSEAHQAARGWVATMIEGGYDSGLARKSETDYSNSGLTHVPWGYYHPTSGTARGDRIPMSSPAAYFQAVNARREATRSLRAAQDAERKRAAEKLWDG